MQILELQKLTAADRAGVSTWERQSAGHGAGHLGSNLQKVGGQQSEHSSAGSLLGWDCQAGETPGRARPGNIRVRHQDSREQGFIYTSQDKGKRRNQRGSWIKDTSMLRPWEP